MNKLHWLSALFIFAISQSVFATNASCTVAAQAAFNRISGTITSFSYNQTFNDNTSMPIISACTQAVAVRSTFRASTGNTDLIGNSPFSVGPSISITGSSANATTLAAAKAWLASNLKVSFHLKDNNNPIAITKDIQALDTDYNILPETGLGVPILINGESYFSGAAGQGTRTVDLRNPIFTMQFLNSMKPSADIITALNNATVGIHLGTLNLKYDNYFGPAAPPSGVPKNASTEVFLNLKLSFNFPTCTINNQIVNLAPVPTVILNSNQTANEQPFNVNINCTAALPNKVLLATITDSYTPSNINTNGILKNSPSLANRSNVDVQLRDDTNTPLAIGTQSPFYSIPAGSTATTFIKALKARYYRSLATATPGYVQTQATVSLDYQ